MSHPPLRIGIVGAGGIVRSRHIPGFRAQPDCTVVVVCNRSRASGARVAREFGIPEVETDWRKLVARPDLNAIVVGTWPCLHRDVTVAALRQGKHVLCESRMASNAAQARAMLKAAREGRRRSGLVAMLCPPPTGLRGDFVVKRLIAEGLLGRPLHLFVRQLHAGLLDPRTPIHWRQRFKYQGLNALTLGMLNEAVGRWFGPTLRVLSAQRIFTARRPAAAGADRTVRVERPDAISVTAEMRNGILATYLLSGVALHPGPNLIEAWGSEGMFRYDLDTDRIYAASRKDPEPREVPVPEAQARVWQVEADFVAAIRQGRPVSPDFQEGVAYMAFTEAVERSSRSGKAVALPVPGRA